jgi:predicted small lipoprotein YifL
MTPIYSINQKHFSLFWVNTYYNTLTINTMKNYFRLPLVALALSLSLAACKGNKSGSSADSSKTDSTTTTKVDSTVKPDTAKKDTSKMMGADTSKKDTVSKTTVKTTEKKSSAIKKN